MSFTFATHCGPPAFPAWPFLLGLIAAFFVVSAILPASPERSLRAAFLPAHFFAIAGLAGIYGMVRALPVFPNNPIPLAQAWRTDLSVPILWGLLVSAFLLVTNLVTGKQRALARRQLHADPLLRWGGAAAACSWLLFAIPMVVPASTIANPAFAEPGHWVRAALLSGLVLQGLLTALHLIFVIRPLVTTGQTVPKVNSSSHLQA